MEVHFPISLANLRVTNQAGLSCDNTRNNNTPQSKVTCVTQQNSILMGKHSTYQPIDVLSIIIYNLQNPSIGVSPVPELRIVDTDTQTVTHRSYHNLLRFPQPIFIQNGITFLVNSGKTVTVNIGSVT